MKIDRISANIRYSQDSGKGAWKALELTAEASLTPNENWQTAQADLYADLAKQFKSLWSANGSSDHDSPRPVPGAP